ncbi:MAG TPA: hypothetical protein VIL20_24565 [Sandaracinaceae bacterium]
MTGALRPRPASLGPWCLGLAAIVLATTGHRFANGFVHDDDELIREGRVIHDPARLPEVWTHHTMAASAADPGQVQSVDTYRPLTLTLFVLDASWSGRSPFGYHLTNLALHVGCTLLVFALAVVWLGRERAGPAFYGAAVFAAHPWLVEAHVWINGRSDPLALLFGLGAALVLALSERSSERRALAGTALAGGLWLLGLLAKETLLLAAPAIAAMPSPYGVAPRWSRFAYRAAALVPSSVAYLAVRAGVLGGLRTHRDAAMLADAAARLPWLLFDSLRHALAPGLPYFRCLRDEYASVGALPTVLGGLAVLLVAIVAWRARRAAPLAAWTALWFFLPIVPVAVLTTVLWPGFGRYLYIPMAGVAWALADVTAKLRTPGGRALVWRALGAAHVLVLGAMAALFTRDHASSESLYGAAIAARPDVAAGHGWLGIARYDAGDARGALGPLLRATELDPGTHRYLVRAAGAALALGDRELTAELAERGLALFSGRPEEAAYRMLAVNSMPARDPQRAVEHLVRCLEVFPGRADCEAALRSLVEDAPDAVENRRALAERAARTRDRALAARLRRLLR